MTKNTSPRRFLFVGILILAAGLAYGEARSSGAAPDSAWRLDTAFDDPVIPCAEALRVVPEREEFPAWLPRARVLFRVRGDLAREGTALEALLLSGSNAVRNLSIPLTRDLRNMDTSLGLAGLSAGAYVLRASLVSNPSTGAVSTVELPLRVRAEQLAAAKSGRIPVTVHAAPESEPDYVLNSAVAFPAGALDDARHIRMLGPDGQEVPLQARETAAWTAYGMPRWVRFAFPARLASQPGAYVLEYGPNVVSGARPAQPVQAAYSPNSPRIVLRTGELEVEIPTNRFNGFEVSLGGRRLMTAGNDTGPYVVDQSGQVFTAAADTNCRVVIEESGPVRAVVKAAGWHVNPLTGERLCQWIVRLYAFAGKPYVKIEHTFVVTFDPKQVRLRDVAYRQIIAGDDPQVTFGVTNTPRFAARAGAPVFLLQEDLDRYWIKSVRGGRTEVLGSGARAEGWFALTTKLGGVGLAMRDLAQNFPKELEADGNRLALHAWPAHARPVVYTNSMPGAHVSGGAPDGTGAPPLEGLMPDDGLEPKRRGYNAAELGQMWSCHGGPELDFELPAYFTRFCAKEGDVASASKTSAAGVSRTQEFLLFFSKPGADPGAVRDENVLFQSLPHALPSPAWTAASGALGEYAPLDTARFPEVEKTIYENFGKSLAAEATHPQWGMWNYGCVHERGAPWATHRIWNNHHYDLPGSFWFQYLRTGDPFYYRHAHRNTWHSLDVDMCHFDRPDAGDVPRLRGGLSYYDFIFHWGGTYHVWAFDTDLRYLHRARDLEGNLRAADVFDEWAELALRTAPAVAGREGGGAMRALYDAYVATWDARFLDMLHWQITQFIGKPLREHHLCPTWGCWPRFVVDFVRRRDLEQALLDYSERLLRDPDPEMYYGTLAVAMAFEHNPDLRFLSKINRDLALDLTVPGRPWAYPSNTPAFPAEHKGFVYPTIFANVAPYILPKFAGRSGPLPEPPAVRSYVMPRPARGGAQRVFLLKDANGPLNFSLLFFYNAGHLVELRDGAGGLVKRETVADIGKPVSFTVPPAGLPGVYTLVITNAAGSQIMASIETTNRHLVALNAMADVAGPLDLFFRVPGGTQTVTLRTDDPSRAEARGPDGEAVEAVKTGRDWVVTVPAALSGKLWRLRPLCRPGNAVSAALEGVPPFVAIHPDRWFDPASLGDAGKTGQGATLKEKPDGTGKSNVNQPGH